MKRIHKRFVWMLAVLLLGISTVTACSTFGQQETNQVEWRTDTKPITSRFPKLGQFEQAYWQGDIIGRSDIGPTSYWMKGYVVLNKDNFEDLKKKYQWQNVDSNWKPSLDSSKLGKDSFEWAYSEEFNNDVKSDDFIGKFYLDLKQGTVFFDVER